MSKLLTALIVSAFALVSLPSMAATPAGGSPTAAAATDAPASASKSHKKSGKKRAKRAAAPASGAQK